MKQMSVLIADDEVLAREAIALRLNGHKEFSIIAEADNGLDAYLLINSLQPDVVFMDINMPKLDGMEALERIQRSIEPSLIFVTAHEQHALRAFRLDALDYLTKPIKDDLFESVLNKVKKRVHEQQAGKQLEKTTQMGKTGHYLKRLSVKDDDETILIDTETIRSITSVKDYLCIKTHNANYIQRQTMRQMSSLLDPAMFIRCHRSHIVNKSYVSKWVQNESENYIVCEEDMIPVSRRFRPHVKNQLQR